jgi:ABC-type multidrug transport system fused ATPase/permease subunit
VAINRMLTARLRSYRRRYRVATAGVAAFLGELFASVLAVRTNGAEDRVLARFERANRERRRAAVRDQVSTDGLIAANGMSVELAVGVVLLVAASTLRRHAFTIGDLALFTAYVEQLSALPRRMGRLLAFHRHATISVERMRQLTEGDPQRLVHPAPVYLKEAPPAPAAAPRHTAPFALLEVRGLTVCHPETGRGVFEVELTATPGAVTALTGEVGAGKSSLCRGLLGLVPVTSGSIRWNGVEVTDPGAFFVPPRAAYVPQVPHLFSESLADNILLGLPGDSVDLASVLALAAFDGDVDGMDDGLATRLGARGVRLSGGQLQRAAIARALVRAPELLVIDDPSSALDVATEERLWDGLLVPRRTCLIVSHRRAVLERADHVIVLDDGHVVDAGPPDVVLARGSVPTRAAG